MTIREAKVSANTALGDTTNKDILDHPVLKLLVEGQQALQTKVGDLAEQNAKLLAQLSMSQQSFQCYGPRTNRPGNLEQVGQSYTCWHCNKKGHLRRDCPVWKSARKQNTPDTGEETPQGKD